ncbi:MAG: hypothetical protein AB7G93_05465 [Bdellovibrionales bacterium]
MKAGVVYYLAYFLLKVQSLISTIRAKVLHICARVSKWLGTK